MDNARLLRRVGSHGYQEDAWGQAGWILVADYRQVSTFNLMRKPDTHITTAWNAFMDLVTAMFPVYMIWRLQLKTSTKWGLTFLIGGSVL